LITQSLTQSRMYFSFSVSIRADLGAINFVRIVLIAQLITILIVR